MGTSATINFPGSNVGIDNDSELKENSSLCRILKMGQPGRFDNTYNALKFCTTYLLNKLYVISLLMVMVKKIGGHQPGQARAHDSDSPLLPRLVVHNPGNMFCGINDIRHLGH
jgi:hypothetical protein